MYHVKHMTSKTKNKQMGDIGETATSNYLQRKGWAIIARNYRRSYFELDIIAKENDVVHFIEVKTVSYATQGAYQRSLDTNAWRPEEQVHARKMHKLRLGVEAWLSENNYDGKWQVDVAAVKLVPSEKFATVKLISNIILE